MVLIGFKMTGRIVKTLAFISSYKQDDPWSCCYHTLLVGYFFGAHTILISSRYISVAQSMHFIVMSHIVSTLGHHVHVLDKILEEQLGQ